MDLYNKCAYMQSHFKHAGINQYIKLLKSCHNMQKHTFGKHQKVYLGDWMCIIFY